eukprot:jgi/Botrbrau1/18007/Bobra.0784s0003.1
METLQSLLGYETPHQSALHHSSCHKCDLINLFIKCSENKVRRSVRLWQPSSPVNRTSGGDSFGTPWQGLPNGDSVVGLRPVALPRLPSSVAAGLNADCPAGSLLAAHSESLSLRGL